MANAAYMKWKENLLRSALVQKALVTGQFELTSRCNLDCKMCYVHNLDHCAAKQKELSTSEWKQIFDQAYDLGLLFATLTGGECLLRQDFKDLYLHLWNKRVRVAVLTNGTMINEDHIDFFRKYKPEYIQISLYGSNEEGYLRVTGHRGFEKTLAALRALKSAGIPVKVAVTPSKYIYDDFISILQLCRKEGFQTGFAEMVLMPNREDPDKNDYYLTRDEIVNLSVQRSALYKTLEPLPDTPDPRGTETVIPQGLRCTAGNCLAYITWDGKMVPCAAVISEHAPVVRELGFAQAWEQTKKMAAEILLPVECVGCAYEKVCVRCPMTRSPKRDGHCDPAICDLTRQLVTAGVKKLGAPEPVDPEHGI